MAITDKRQKWDEIMARWKAATPVVVVGTTVPYAMFVEYGTRFMAPRWFLRDTIAAHRDYFDDLLDLARSIVDLDANPSAEADKLGQKVAQDVKSTITAKGAVRTGTLRDSIAHRVEHK